MEKILLDTDIGSDIDDAVCLSYLLCNPDCQLMGITTVSGQPLERAMLCDALCRAAGKSVPIYPGVGSPLIIGQRQPEVPQAEKLALHPHGVGFPANAAIDFLRDTILQNPGEITLLAIGPMTNIALLFATYPETAGLLKGLTLMCGDFLRPDRISEWNARCDPHAAHMVYASAAKPHRSVGLDVTTRVTMSSAEVGERFTHPVLKVAADFSEIWFRRRDTLTFHDPLAAVTIFNKDICRFESGEVTVNLVEADGRDAGATSFAADSDGRQLIAAEVDPARFFKEFFSVFEG